MNTRKPIQAKSTERILTAVFPRKFKMVNDKTSNGYKYVNLLMGVEIDEAFDRTRKVYNDSYLDSFDTSTRYDIYQVDISGAPNTKQLTADSDVSVKVTNEDEFYNGSPTRFVYSNKYAWPMSTGTYSGDFNTDNAFGSGFFTQGWSTVSGIIGLEYFRSNHRGSGHFIIFSDNDQDTMYLQSQWPDHRVDINTNFQESSDFDRTYGFFTGIREQSYRKTSRYEVLNPITERTLSGQYPLHRQVTDESGVIHTIDHYEPYHGWTFDENGNAVAVVDYSGEYYYDPDGNKIYYRTAYNNPYGFGNYNVAYLDLENVPISGTLKVYDIDILDESGNAIEIPKTGKDLYYYKSDRMLYGNSGYFEDGAPDAIFDPFYLGYESTVPNDKGFSNYSVGKAATLYKTVSWDYLHEGGGIEEQNLQYVDGSGKITDRIKITNPQTRYMVEYLYKTHDKSKYISSLDSNGYVSQETLSPIYSVSIESGNLVELPFEFTNDPSLNKRRTQSKIITFDGLKVRPYRYLYKIDFNIPLQLDQGILTKPLYINGNDTSIGHSTEFVPLVNNNRNYVMNCPFDQNVVANAVTESDLTGNSNTLEYTNTGTNYVYKINYGSYFGKKIIRRTGDSYFKIENTSFLKDYVVFYFGFKAKKRETGTLIELYDNTNDRYLIGSFNKNGVLSFQCDGYLYQARESFAFNNLEKQIMLKVVSDDVSSSVPILSLFYKQEGDLSFREISLHRSEYTQLSVASTYLHLFKNFNAECGFMKIFYEVQ